MKFTAYIMHVMCLVHVQFIHYTHSILVHRRPGCLSAHPKLVYRVTQVLQKHSSSSASNSNNNNKYRIRYFILCNVQEGSSFVWNLYDKFIVATLADSCMYDDEISPTTTTTTTIYFGEWKKTEKCQNVLTVMINEKRVFASAPCLAIRKFSHCVRVCVCMSHINQEPAHYHHRHHPFTSSTNEKEMRESLVSVCELCVCLSVENMCMNLLKPKLIWYFIIV